MFEFDDQNYDELEEEYLALAQQVRDPQIRATYLRLALGYRKLAQFREQVRPLMYATGEASAQQD